MLDVRVGDVALAAILTVPPGARGIVILVRGTGSGRLSPRGRAVADALVDAGLGTLQLDLLTDEEAGDDAQTRRLRVDVELLGRRVVGAIDWLAADAVVGDLPPALRRLPVGILGAGTGAAAALVAAAARADRVRALVSRGGRPDLAGDALARVAAPTLLIVGGDDPEVLRRNREALARLGGEVALEVVEGAGHGFEQPGALERVTELTRAWFARHLAPAR